MSDYHRTDKGDPFAAFNRRAEERAAELREKERQEAGEAKNTPPIRPEFFAVLTHGQKETTHPIFDRIRLNHDGFIQKLKGVLGKIKAVDYLESRLTQYDTVLCNHAKWTAEGKGTPQVLKTADTLSYMVSLLNQIEGTGSFSTIKERLEAQGIDWEKSSKTLKDDLKSIIAELQCTTTRTLF